MTGSGGVGGSVTITGGTITARTTNTGNFAGAAGIGGTGVTGAITGGRIISNGSNAAGGVSTGIAVSGGIVDSNNVRVLGACFENAPLGSGTQNDPWQISTPEDIAWISGDSPRLNMYYLLMNDIDATELGSDVAIGTDFVNFNGNFNGNGNTITIDISDSWIRNAGLFPEIDAEGVVANLTVGGFLSEQFSRTGALAGINRGTIIVIPL
jgi:hypothetical protein